MSTKDLGQLVGCYQSHAIPFWVEWAMYLPYVRRKVARRAVSEIRIYERGLVLMQRRARSRVLISHILLYTEVRRVWFERFQTGSETSGHTAFRIDIIAQNLDVLFSLTEVDCSSQDPNLLLMEQLYLKWKTQTHKDSPAEA